MSFYGGQPGRLGQTDKLRSLKHRPKVGFTTKVTHQTLLVLKSQRSNA